MKMLLYIYLDPSSLSLRKSLEWIVDVIANNITINSDDIKEAIREVCINIINQANTEESLEEASIDICMSWVLSFTAMAMLDKDISFLEDISIDSKNEMDRSIHSLENDGILLELFQVLLQIFERFSTLAVPSKIDSTTKDSSTEVMRYAECCGEVK